MAAICHFIQLKFTAATFLPETRAIFQLFNRLHVTEGSSADNAVLPVHPYVDLITNVHMAVGGGPQPAVSGLLAIIG